MAEMMKCAIYNGIGNVSVEERPIPDVGRSFVPAFVALMSVFLPTAVRITEFSPVPNSVMKWSER